jgi:hypothetical protein
VPQIGQTALSAENPLQTGQTEEACIHHHPELFWHSLFPRGEGHTDLFVLRRENGTGEMALSLL